METMKTDLKHAKPQESRRDDGSIIPVYELRFCVVGGRDLGLDESGGTGRLRVREGRTIDYLPQRRFFRIVELSKDPKHKPRTIYVPETWAAFEPLE